MEMTIADVLEKRRGLFLSMVAAVEKELPGFESEIRKFDEKHCRKILAMCRRAITALRDGDGTEPSIVDACLSAILQFMAMLEAAEAMKNGGLDERKGQKEQEEQKEDQESQQV